VEWKKSKEITLFFVLFNDFSSSLKIPIISSQDKETAIRQKKENLNPALFPTASHQSRAKGIIIHKEI
jgi:hypothetical protein